MLSVIVDARRDLAPVPALLAQLTAGAVDGLVGDVALLAAQSELMAAICGETGAERFEDLATAAVAARSERLLVLPAAFRFRDGWIGALRGEQGRDGLVRGLGRPAGVLVGRARAVRDGADLQGLRRQLGLWPRRLG